MPHNNNLGVWLNIGNCILKRVLIEHVVDISILYKGALPKMGFLPSMLNTPICSLKSFDNSLTNTLGLIWLPIKLGNDDDGYFKAEETFYVVDAPTRYNAVMSTIQHHKIGVSR